MKSITPFAHAMKITLAYVAIGVLWIYFSDGWVELIAHGDAEQMQLMQTYKGIFYIAVTALFLFGTVYYFFSRQEQSHSLLKTIVDQSPDAIYTKDQEGKYKIFNQGAAKMVGIEPEDVIGKTDTLLFSPETAAKILHDDDQVLRGDDAISFQETIVTSSGEEKHLWCTKGPLRDASGKVYGLFGISRDITEQVRYDKTIAETNEKLDRLAHIDPLTSLPNRLSLIEYLEHRFTLSDSLPYALIFLDLDGFQEINDSYGHRFGDNLLIEFSQLLRDVFAEESNYIVRTGGDEFVVIVPIVEESAIAFSLDRLIERLKQSFSIEGIDVYTSASIGIANYPHDAQSAEELLRYADAAMYQAKKKGKNTYRFYDPSYTQQAIVRTTVTSNLKKALQEGGFYLQYQPQIDPYSRSLIGYEALLRWDSPEGAISPAVFIPVCEESGLILRVGELVLREGFSQALIWYRSGLLKGQIAINVSPRQLVHTHFVATLEKIVEETGCDPRLIELEITESSILDNPEKTIATLGILKTMGFKIAIDDFGTGYSSLSYLKNLPVDKLKIDISFIRNITHEPKNQTIVKTIIALAKGLGMEVIAEGVETKEELDFLMANGIDSVQGFYFYRPLDAQEIGQIAL